MTAPFPGTPAQQTAEAAGRATVLAWFREIYRATTDAGILNTRQAAALFSIGLSPGRSTSAIADDIGENRPTTTRAVLALVEAGMATNRVDPQDNRLRIVELTAAGQEAIGQITDALGSTTDKGHDP